MAKIVNTSVEHLNKLMEALVDIATAAPVGPWTATESSCVRVGWKDESAKLLNERHRDGA